MIFLFGHGGGTIKRKYIMTVLVLFSLTLLINASDVSAVAVNGSTSTVASSTGNGTVATEVTPKLTFTTGQICSGAFQVKNYTETNNQLPDTVTLSSTEVNMAQFLQLLTDSLLQTNTGSTALVTLKNVNKPPSQSESLTTGTWTKSEYLSIAQNIKNTIDSTGTAPATLSNSLGTMNFENLVYTYSRIMNFYKTNNRLPNTVSIKALTTNNKEGNNNTNSTITFTTGQICSGAFQVKNYTETNNQLPDSVTLSSTEVNMAQFLHLLTDSLLQTSTGSTALVTLKNVNKPPSQSESLNTGTWTKSEYLSIAQNIKNTIDSTGTAPATLSNSLGTMNFENLVYTYSRIMNFYKTNNRLPNTVSIKALTTSTPLIYTDGSTQSIIDAIGYAEAKFEDIQGQSSASVMEKVGYGDCWADSEWLYNKLNAAGIAARIMGYVGGGSGVWYEHAWVQINIGNGWITWNYTKYGSQHYGDGLKAASYVLIAPSNKIVDLADMVATGY